MGAYLPLFSIAAEHTFFSTGLCEQLEYVPTPQSASLLKRAGILTRKTTHGIQAFYDESKTEALELYVTNRNEPFCLGFKVISNDASFTNYTAPSIQRSDAVLYFDSRRIKSKKVGRKRLHTTDYVSEANFEKLDSAVVVDLLDKKDKLVRPHFLVNICVNAIPTFPSRGSGNAQSNDYYLTFQARQTFWKYHLLGDIAKQNLSVADVDGKTEFEPAGNASLPDARAAITFRSTTPIPLRETFDRRFQLRENGTGNGKVLIKRLPVASAFQINTETVEQQTTIVSDIYINF